MHHGDISPEIAAAIRILRDRMDDQKVKIPPSALDESLNLATWNIREFGNSPRSDKAIHLIAEILSQFDLIAITELRDNLADFKRVLDILGPYWKVVYSDFRSDGAGNDERIAFLYDKRMVVFTGLAAEANPPRARPAPGAPYEYMHDDWWRSPYMASFRAGNFDFIVMAAHMRWGDSVAERAEALGHLADWVQARRTHPFVSDKDIILLGDFNIPSKGSSTYKQLTKHGLKAPASLMKAIGTNLSQRNCYDQIMIDPTNDSRFTGKGGALDFFKGDHTPLFPELTQEAFTFQLSDHLPLWIQVDVWIEDEQINSVLLGAGGG
ncbi:endonuclease/exonuclease/phosphatase family protein [Pseudokordiimonas caeni]|uniref:endonuclease/exonuclease/phosphatase family protein n=1 Tax=Pseudokordiimonas caeni TaxID=2997908 RepID=UPI00281242C0|nr:endonuclease/exonuclease/phosphatase family protein [Pseudokordiimonas caeni]